MYCPQCGQHQVSDATRYCARCGFLLDGTMAVLSTGGAVPTRYLQPTNQKPSPRSKGIRQGAMLMLSTILIVPIVAIITLNILPEESWIFIPLTALFCFVGGLLRILYALLMEDAFPQPDQDHLLGYGPPTAPQFEHSSHKAALPPPPVATHQPPAWRPHPSTAEIYQPPPSITENTTRLLDKEDQKKR